MAAAVRSTTASVQKRLYTKSTKDNYGNQSLLLQGSVSKTVLNYRAQSGHRMLISGDKGNNSKSLKRWESPDSGR